MFISEDKRKYVRSAAVYLGISVLTLIFGTVYEHFSHGVFSWHMAFLFLFPLIGGTLPYSIAAFCGGVRNFGRIAECLWNSGVAALTVGSCVQGVLEIYGTSSCYLPVFYIAGGAFCASGAVLYVGRICRTA